MAILDLSKLHMYNFYYEVLKPKYGDNIKLAYTDTDSFVIHTKTEDIYSDFKTISHNMDFSDYPTDNPLHNLTNKKRLGCFKDEVNGKIISEFIGLKPKMYAMRVDEGGEEKKAKGIPKQIVKRELNFDSYKRTLEDTECKKQYVQFNCLRSMNHQIYSLTCNKAGLSNYDNKRYYLCNNESLPYGHCRLLQS